MPAELPAGATAAGEEEEGVTSEIGFCVVIDVVKVVARVPLPLTTITGVVTMVWGMDVVIGFVTGVEADGPLDPEPAFPDVDDDNVEDNNDDAVDEEERMTAPCVVLEEDGAREAGTPIVEASFVVVVVIVVGVEGADAIVDTEDCPAVCSVDTGATLAAAVDWPPAVLAVSSVVVEGGDESEDEAAGTTMAVAVVAMTGDAVRGHKALAWRGFGEDERDACQGKLQDNDRVQREDEELTRCTSSTASSRCQRGSQTRC